MRLLDKLRGLDKLYQDVENLRAEIEDLKCTQSVELIQSTVKEMRPGCVYVIRVPEKTERHEANALADVLRENGIISVIIASDWLEVISVVSENDNVGRTKT